MRKEYEENRMSFSFYVWKVEDRYVKKSHFNSKVVFRVR